MQFILETFRRGRNRQPDAEEGMSDSTLQPPLSTVRRPTIMIPAEDQLTIFRHLVGIHSTRSFRTKTPGTPDLTHNTLHFDGRAAPNLGIYNRVVHREQEAKRGYKFAAFLISGCLGLQIVVAASLTAMGAANSGHAGITVFGAINTIIAGLLTYLKGSGLPMRLRYYENEWKKVREYIEQRERDFCRPNCPLNVYEVVDVIESMYEDVKADIQTNTPDSWVSVGDLRNKQTATDPQVPTSQHGLMKHPKRLEELESKYGREIADFVQDLVHKEEERLKRFGGDMENGLSEKVREVEGIFRKDFEIAEARISDAVKDLEKEVVSIAPKVHVESGSRDITESGRETDDEIHLTKPKD